MLSARHKLHTSQGKIAEMLELAGRVVADSASKLPAAESSVCLNVVTESQGAKAARNIVNVLRMKAIGMKPV